MPTYDSHRVAAAIVSDAGGKLVGRTRLQKVAYLAHLAGFSDEFEFEYRHYGPFSEDLASAMEIARVFGFVDEEEIQAEWGGRYSIYKSKVDSEVPADEDRSHFVSEAANIDAILLELAATAAYLYAEEGVGNQVDGDPWEETKRRKPDKAEGNRIALAKKEYKKLLSLNTPKQLPQIV